MVCSSPIGSGWSPYARPRGASSTKRWRGTLRIAPSTRTSVIPRRSSCSSTICARTSANGSHTPATLLAPRALPGRRAVLGVEATAEVRERVERPVVGEVEVERRDRDVALVEGAHVGALKLLPLGRARADPVVGAPPRVRLFHDLLAVDAVAETREADAARRGWHVHVEERLLRQARDENPQRDESRHLGGDG